MAVPNRALALAISCWSADERGSGLGLASRSSSECGPSACNFKSRCVSGTKAPAVRLVLELLRGRCACRAVARSLAWRMASSRSSPGSRRSRCRTTGGVLLTPQLVVLLARLLVAPLLLTSTLISRSPTRIITGWSYAARIGTWKLLRAGRRARGGGAGASQVHQSLSDFALHLHSRGLCIPLSDCESDGPVRHLPAGRHAVLPDLSVQS